MRGKTIRNMDRSRVKQPLGQPLQRDPVTKVHAEFAPYGGHLVPFAAPHVLDGHLHLGVFRLRQDFTRSSVASRKSQAKAVTIPRPGSAVVFEASLIHRERDHRP
ncbi:MAG: hypothetical protein ACQESR_18445 [Planctomycetota bacterium]